MTDIHHSIRLTLLALILAPVGGALLRGLDRKLTARIQGRRGPSIFQTFYDIAKLLRKRPIVLNRFQIVYAYLHLAFLMLAMLLVLLGQDMLMILFSLAFATLALVLGGMCVRSPYSRIGSQREIMLLVAYEPVLVLTVIGVYLVTGSFKIASVLALPHPLLSSLPLLFVAFLLVVAAKLQKSPFDLATSHHAHQELVKGITIEYSGPYLAILEMAHCYEVALLFTLLMMFWATSLQAGFALAAGCFFLAILADNVFARLTTLWAFRFFWTVALAMALANVLWLN